MSRKRIVILGGGTGGTMVANRLRRRFDADEAEIHVVDRDDRHVYQPGLLFVPFGLASLEEIVRPRRRQLRSGVVFHEAEVAWVELDHDEVVLLDGDVLPYDALVVASGVRLQPEETDGLTGPGWNERVFTFYAPEGAEALRGALERFDGGRLVVNLVDMPIKCPVAPLEFVFLADWHLRERGIRDRTELVYSTPLDGAFTKPVASQHLAGLLAEKEIELVTEFNAGEVDGVGGTLGLVRRPLARLRPARDDPAPRRSRVPRTDARARGRARLRPHRQGDAADDGQAERVRPWRRDRSADLEGGLRHPFRGRDPERERRALLRRRGARAWLRRACELLHRDRLPQGAADRLQLRDRAAARPLPDGFRPAALEESRLNHLGKLALPVGLLARAAARPRDSRHRPVHADPPARSASLSTPERGARDDHDPHRRRAGRRRRRRLPHEPRAVERADRARRSPHRTASPS